ncbi:hypothetical protein LEMLEM_LOCUS12550, partial [Lemmus lemmus]
MKPADWKRFSGPLRWRQASAYTEACSVWSCTLCPQMKVTSITESQCTPRKRALCAQG